jgi:hypothetical protein
MAFEIYDTVTLLGVIRKQHSPSNYWLSYFPDEQTFETEEIMFDMITEGRALAPFVAPNVQGRVMKSRGSTTKTFRPAYVKPKHEVNPQRALKRAVGEGIGGTEMSLEERYDAIVADNMRQERELIERRWEWMAARAIIDGEVTVSGDDYPSVTVDFGRDASLDITLAGTARWDQADAAPLADIQDARAAVVSKGRTSVTRLTFGQDAWDSFIADADVKELLDKSYRGSDSDFNRSLGSGEPWELRGRLSGSGSSGAVELYTYNDKYEDEDGVETEFMAQNLMVGTSPGIKGVRCFGAIKDKKAGLKPLSLFPKMWDVEDPSQTLTMTQSAPLMVPTNVDGCFKMVVQDA